MSLGLSPPSILLGWTNPKSSLAVCSFCCWEQGAGGGSLCRERLAPPSAKGPRSAFVDIFQGALSTGDISEIFSLTGLQDGRLTNHRAPCSSSEGLRPQTPPRHEPHIPKSSEVPLSGLVLSWLRGLCPTLNTLSQGAERLLWAQNLSQQTSMPAYVTRSPWFLLPLKDDCGVLLLKCEKREVFHKLKVIVQA